MEFQTNIFEGVEPPSSSKYNLIGTKLPTSQDVYFVSKWHELFERYEMARIFLSKTEEDNWDYWFDKVDDEVENSGNILREKRCRNQEDKIGFENR